MNAASKSDLQLSHSFGDEAEEWLGTKEQIQAEGIGVGQHFPGEPGAPDRLVCQCPLGFQVAVVEWKIDGRRVYRAMSHYAPETQELGPPEPFSLGVTRARRYWRWDYVGAAEDLVAAGLARLDQFPGQPGRPKSQASYREDGEPSTSSPAGSKMQIRKLGRGMFHVSVAFTREEREQRIAERAAAQEAHKRACEAARKERRRLRELAEQDIQPTEALAKFREERNESLEMLLDMVWRSMALKDGAFSLQLEDGDRQQVARAFESLRGVVRTAAIRMDGKALALVRNRKQLAAARSDEGLQGFIRSATKLSLVR